MTPAAPLSLCQRPVLPAHRAFNGLGRVGQKNLLDQGFPALPCPLRGRGRRGLGFQMVHGREGFIGLSVIFFVIYVFVWLSSHWLDKQDEKKINRALDDIRDKE